jgi:hypothetical protein
MCSLFVCACSCVLCFVNAWKINVTCLVKVLSKNGSRGQKYALRIDAFSAVCPPDVLYLLYRFCFSLFLSLSSSSRPRIERVVCIRRRFFLAPPFFSRGVVLYSLFGALEVPSVRSDVFFLQVVFTRHFRLFDLCKYLRQSSSFCQTLFAAFVFTRLISFPHQILQFS